MAGRIVAPVRATVTAASSSGYLTVTSAAGLYVGAYCNLSLTAGGSPISVQITEINSNQVGVRALYSMYGTGPGPNYGRSDVSAYNAGGFLFQDSQLIYNPNDKPLD